MIKCPNCEHISSEILLTGPVLIATGMIEVSEDGSTVVAVSPLKAIQTIRAGEELTMPGGLYQCTRCNFQDRRENFPVMAMCLISGKATSNFAQLSSGISVYVLPEYVNEAERIFSRENMAWATEITIEELRNV